MGTIVHSAIQGEPYFEYDTNGITLSFEYKPPIKNQWDNLDDFVVSILENPYLNNESNIFDLYLYDKEEERIGWIFPLNALESDVVESKGNLLNYLYITYQILLNRIEELNSSKCLIGDYYQKDSILCVVHKETANKLSGEEFNIDNYEMSLYMYGYSLIRSEERAKTIPHYIHKYDKRIHIKRTKSLCSDSFVNQLINNELPYADNFLYRFIFLYQFVEYLMDIESEQGIMDIIAKYNAGNIDKNTLLADVRDLISEPNLIKNIFNKVDIEKTILSSFSRECNQLFSNASFIPSSKDNPMLFYNLRNQIVHSYRKYLIQKEQLITTIQCFEKIILEIIIGYE